MIEGLEIPESSGTSRPTQCTEEPKDNTSGDNNSNFNNIRNDNPKVNKPNKTLQTNSDLSLQAKQKRTMKFVDNDLLNLKKQKIKQETSLYEEKKQIAIREKYKLDLELYKLEKELGLPPSEFTAKFYGINYHVVEECVVEEINEIENEYTNEERLNTLESAMECIGDIID